MNIGNTKTYLQLVSFVILLMTDFVPIMAQSNLAEIDFSMVNNQEIEQLLTTKYQHKIGENANLTLIFTAETKLSKHLLFQENINGIAVENAFIKLNIDNKGKLISSQKALKKSDIGDLEKQTLLSKKANVKDYNLEKEAEWVYVENETGELELLQKFWVEKSGNYFYLYYDQYHNFIKQIDRAIYHHADAKCGFCHHQAHQLLSDSLIQVAVFEPDPLTTAQTTYGGAYIDNDDQSSSALNSERTLKEVSAKYENGTFILENDYVEITDNMPPNIAPYQTSNATIDIGREEDGFEAVMVYYHISKFQAYIQNLGFNFNQVVNADPHSLNGADQSRFVSDADGQLFLDFGEGGVDDAEDADVIIHEYIHALSYMASNTNNGNERRALDEALGDYFATSWSRQYSDYRWQDMFTWDGHNDFWDGRNMQTNKVYPDDVSTEIYGSSEVFSSALMEIYEAIGREKTDKLALQLLYFLTQNMSMPEAGIALLKVDELLFEAQNKTTISQILYKRGLLNQLDISAGIDTTICIGESVFLGEQGWHFDDLIFEWTTDNNDEFVSNANSGYIQINPLENTTYQLQITDNKHDNIYYDEVNITVDNCFDESEYIRLLNPEAFTAGQANLLLYFSPQVTNYTYQLVDVSGRAIVSNSANANGTKTLAIKNLPPNIYFLQVNFNQEPTKVFKLIKLL